MVDGAAAPGFNQSAIFTGGARLPRARRIVIPGEHELWIDGIVRATKRGGQTPISPRSIDLRKGQDRA